MPPTPASLLTLRDYIERSLGPLVLSDASNVIVAASRGIATMLGYDRPQELRGVPASTHVLDGAHDGDAEQDGIATVRRRDGTTFRFAYHVQPVIIGNRQLFLADGHIIRPPPARRPYVPPDAWLTRQEAAERARVSVKTLDRAISRGDLQASRIGRAVRIRRRWLDAWLGMILP